MYCTEIEEGTPLIVVRTTYHTRRISKQSLHKNRGIYIVTRVNRTTGFEHKFRDEVWKISACHSMIVWHKFQGVLVEISTIVIYFLNLHEE